MVYEGQLVVKPWKLPQLLGEGKRKEIMQKEKQQKIKTIFYR